jgi:hypothetical protein
MNYKSSSAYLLLYLLITETKEQIRRLARVKLYLSNVRNVEVALAGKSWRHDNEWSVSPRGNPL